MAEYAAATARIYRSILEVAGATTVLDTSKLPILAWLLSERPDVDLWVLHVTRDPRAVVHSWKRRTFDPGRDGYLAQGGALLTSLAWLTSNGLAAELRKCRPERYLQLRYEDLATNPRTVLDDVLEWFAEPRGASQIIDDEATFHNLPGHTIAGNPMRFDNCRKRIEMATEWRDKLSLRDRLLATAVTSPLLFRYGYRMLA